VREQRLLRLFHERRRHAVLADGDDRVQRVSERAQVTQRLAAERLRLGEHAATVAAA
jgi:hypothetical protein